MNNQNELIVERPRSFIDLSVAEIRGTYLDFNLIQTRIQCVVYVRVWMHLTRSSCFESRISTAIMSRVSTAIESRVFTTIETRVSTSFKFAFPLVQHDYCIYEGCVLSHTKSMSLLLQSVQQYTGKSN